MAIKPSPDTPSQPLSFPAPTFAKLAPSTYLHTHLTTPPFLRPSARHPQAFRPPTVHTGSLSHASGSAVVRLGDTAVVCGVRGEVLLASDVAELRDGGRGSMRDVDEDEESMEDMDEDEESEGPVQGEERTSVPEKKQQLSARTRRRRDEDREELAELGLLVPNLELATGCSPAHLPGAPPSVLAQSLSQRILTLLHGTELVALEDLRIWYTPPSTSSSITTTTTTTTTTPKFHKDSLEATGTDSTSSDSDPSPPEKEKEIKAFWTLYIDILFISLDGNPFDAAWFAVLAALQTTRLPAAWWDADRRIILCSDRIAESRSLRLRGFPVAATFAVFEPQRGAGLRGGGGEGRGDGGGEEGKKRGPWLLADPDAFEEGLCAEGVTVVVDGDGGEVVRVEKAGGGVVGVAEMRQCVDLAGVRWKEWGEVVRGG